MKLTGGQALAQQLLREGITDIFGIPGVQLDWAVDGLRQVSDRICFLVPRHEQATSYMADGYARTTDRIGTCMVVPGPGLLNAMSGLATAYACNSRVLCIAGNILSSAIGRGYGLAAGLGVAVGNPGRAVVSIIGEGGFGWNMQELATARKYDLGFVSLVFNDGHFGNVRTLQKEQFGHLYGVELMNPRFDKLAEAFDIPYARVEDPDALKDLLREALTRGGPVLIEARVGDMPNSWHLFRLQPPFGRPSRSEPPNPLGDPPACPL